MNDGKYSREQRLPEASEGFTRAILEGAGRVRRYELRHGRRARLALLAATFALIALGIGMAANRLASPRADRVALSANPDSVDGGGEASGKTGETRPTPAPEEAVNPGKPAEQPSIFENTPAPIHEAEGEVSDAPEAEEAQAEVPDAPAAYILDGITYLTDDGPFKAGDRLVLTNDQGGIVYGMGVDFFELPTLNSRYADALSGMQVIYLGEGENGFARVRFAGNEGYVKAACLRRGVPLPSLGEKSGWEVYKATLFLTNAHGSICIDSVSDALSCYALYKLLEGLAPAGELPAASTSTGMLLVVHLKVDETEEEAAQKAQLRLTMDKRGSLDTGTLEWITEDGKRYTLSDTETRMFWSMFPDIKREMW